MTEKQPLPAEAGEFHYNSKLEEWDGRAAVRAKPRRMLRAEEASGKVFFPPELVPIACHPNVVALGPEVRRDVLVRHLYTYLDFTTLLEHDVVNIVAHRIAHRQIGADFPAAMLFDAYKLYCDEAYHALFSEDLKLQVAGATGIVPDERGTPSFLRRLRSIQASVSSDMRSLVEVFFTIVSETLISATLSDIPRASNVVTAVRELVADHAEDEGRHHAYFSSVLRALWPQLSMAQQLELGPLLPEFVLGFLEPDLAAARRLLQRYDLGSDEIDRVVHEAYPTHTVQTGVRQAAGATLRLFEHTGVLEHPSIAEAFRERGLLA